MPNCSPPNYPGSPPYAPTFVASVTTGSPSNTETCRMDTYNELRARAWAGGTFFRTKYTGLDKNKLSIELVLDNSGATEFWTLFVRKLVKPIGGSPNALVGEIVETIGGGSPIILTGQGDPSEGICSPNLIADLRAAVNTDSVYIEMPTIDYGGEFDDGLAIFLPIFESATDDAGCLSPFADTPFTTGEGGPASDEGPPITGIPPETQPRTGPERTIYGIKLSEIVAGTPTNDGQSYNPVPADKAKQWDGAAWVSYESGVCL